MTLEELQNKYVRRLANIGWVRYWIMCYHPHSTDMGLEVLDYECNKIEIKELSEYNNGKNYYRIPRTNEDGSPYESKL